MPFCPNCGNSVDGRFCQKCGSAVAAAAADPSYATAPAAGAASAAPLGQPVVANAGLTENAASAICYAAGFITGVIFLALAPYNQNPRIRFHAFQSIFFNLAWIAAWMVAWMAMMVLAMVLPYGFSMLISLFSMLVWFGGLLAWLFLIWKASQGENVSLPVIGPIAKRQAGS